MAKKTNVAVITADVVDSSSLGAKSRKQLLLVMQQGLTRIKEAIPDWKQEIFQGDSFQGYTPGYPTQSLRASLLFFTIFRQNEFTIRLSIGMGSIEFTTGSPLTSDGSAFQHSGRMLDELKKKTGNLVGIQTDDEEKNNEWAVHCITLNYLLQRCSKLQAEVLVPALEHLTQSQTAELLGIKQPSVQQRLQAAGWPVIKSILQRFESTF